MLRGVPTALTDELTAICGAERVVTHADALRTYESDGLLQYRALPRAVAPTHFYPPDPSSQVVCSIGGNVAENSGGAHCFKYGFTTNYVTGLKVVLSDGSVETLGGKGVDNPGYDLLGAFVGSEGTLGVAVEITLRMEPKPAAVRTLVAFFDHTTEAGTV